MGRGDPTRGANLRELPRAGGCSCAERARRGCSHNFVCCRWVPGRSAPTQGALKVAHAPIRRYKQSLSHEPVRWLPPLPPPQAWDTLAGAFERTVLQTHRSKFVQFVVRLLFSFCSAFVLLLFCFCPALLVQLWSCLLCSCSVLLLLCPRSALLAPELSRSEPRAGPPRTLPRPKFVCAVGLWRAGAAARSQP